MDTWAEQGIREAKATRERLEKMSSSNSGRRDFVGVLNALIADAAGKELPGLAALEGIRKMQRHGYRTAADHNRAYEKFERAVAESFNRLHPKRASSAPVAANVIGSDDARDQRFTSDLEARRLLDAAGRLASSNSRDQDHWPSGEPEAVAAQFLLDEARRLIAAIRAQTVREAAEDRVAGRIPGAGRG
jgi:hypothetical protein